MTKIVYCVILSILILIVSLYGIAYPLKARWTLGFNIKYFYKTEESTRFVRRTYGIGLFIFDIFYCIYCFLVMNSTIPFHHLLTILVMLGVGFIPVLFAMLACFVVFNKDGSRK